MKVKTIVNRDVTSCSAEDGLSAAAQVMWERDCGLVPVVNRATGVLQGVVTDRDLCMAALLSNRPTGSIPVREVMAGNVESCQLDDDLRDVHAIMRESQIRRLPVVDDEGVLVGMVSLTDLAQEAFASRSRAATQRQRDIARTLAAVCRPRNGAAE